MNLRWKIASSAGLIALGMNLVGCLGSGDDQPTETPYFIIVTGETPDVVETEVTQEAETPVPETALPTPTTLPGCEGDIVQQAYENGHMFWVGKTLEERCIIGHDFALGSGEIWVVIFGNSGQDGDWLRFDDDWNPDVELEDDPAIDAPEGLVEPVRGFGKVWREKLTDDERETLGWATGPEFLFLTSYGYDDEAGLHSLVGFVEDVFWFDEMSGMVTYFPPE